MIILVLSAICAVLLYGGPCGNDDGFEEEDEENEEGLAECAKGAG